MIKRLAMVTLVALSVTLGLLAQAAEEPAFRDFNGQPRTIESYTGGGKWLVVMIWAHDCHVCNMEAESYAHFHESHKDKDATILGVSLDGQANKADAQAFIQRHDLPFPNLIGEPDAVMLYFMMATQTQFRGTPSILVYNPDGQLVAAQAGAVPPEVIEAFIAEQSGAAKSG